MTALRPAADAHQADWVAAGKRGFAVVGDVVPAVYEDYARVFHPASHDGVEVRWAEVAGANGRVLHPVAEWGSLVGSWQLRDQPGLWDQPPRIGALPERLAKRIAEVLRPFTRGSDRCLFGVWEGWGVGSVFVLVKEGTADDEVRRAQGAAEARVATWQGFLESAPTLALPAQREMHLLEGPLDGIADFYEEPHQDPPSLWWAGDRAWCVGTDIDLTTTYIGASAEAISALLADDQLEALRVRAEQRVDWEADSVNPLPEPPD